MGVSDEPPEESPAESSSSGEGAPVEPTAPVEPVEPTAPGVPPTGGGTWEGFGPGAWGRLGDDTAGWGMPTPGIGPTRSGLDPTGAGAGGISGLSLSGKLLVAAPGMVDPNFARTVVLVLHHDSGGSLGLVLNRPSQLDLAEPLRQWVGLAGSPSVVFVGGPVASAAAICLGRLRPADFGPADNPDQEGGPPLDPLHQLAYEQPQGWRWVWAGIGTLDLTGDPGAAALSVGAIRVFAGYAGWGPGQLAAELSLGGWMVVDPTEDDPFSPDPDGLWKSVLRRQSAEVAILASYPEDLSTN